jgi:16S rRNA (cytidine1402-2'-O)-methyltransferase
MAAAFGESRHVVIARELTKTFETVYGNTVAAVLEWMRADPQQLRGEFVVIVRGAEKPFPGGQDTDRLLVTLLETLPINQAAQIAAKLTGERKNLLYQRALELQKNSLENSSS